MSWKDKRTCTQDIHVDCNNHKENYFVDVRNSVYVRFNIVFKTNLVRIGQRSLAKTSAKLS